MQASSSPDPTDGTGFGPHHPKLGLTFSWAPGFMVAVVSLLSAQGRALYSLLCVEPESDKCRSGSARVPLELGSQTGPEMLLYQGLAWRG